MIDTLTAPADDLFQGDDADDSSLEITELLNPTRFNAYGKALFLFVWGTSLGLVALAFYHTFGMLQTVGVYGFLGISAFIVLISHFLLKDYRARIDAATLATGIVSFPLVFGATFGKLPTLPILIGWGFIALLLTATAGRMKRRSDHRLGWLHAIHLLVAVLTVAVSLPQV